jgi:allophanate hydrolase
MALGIEGLALAVRTGEVPLGELLEGVCKALLACPDGVWIHLATRPELEAQLHDIQARIEAGEDLPLAGVPFAVKDNIDVMGWPTTAACPDFAYTPENSADVVERIKAAGALLVGKTNLDQFATGLVGTRSPYGVCRNPLNPAYISGGSSSGSAAAGALGAALFSLGTDTAGSGRVPAAFCELVGLKPTRGALSIEGVVPACRSLDCVAIFARSLDDARLVWQAARWKGPETALARPVPESALSPAAPKPGFTVGVLAGPDRQFFGDEAAAAAYEAALERLDRLGARLVEINYTPFAETAALLYGGPWVAERYLVVKDLLEKSPESIHPVVRQIVQGGGAFTAADLFTAEYRLAELRLAAHAELAKVDCLLLPTTPTIYTVEEVLSDPVTLNSRLGTYTNFVNLLDMAAVAVPAGKGRVGMPFGVTFMGPAFSDLQLLEYAEVFTGGIAPAAPVETPAREIKLAVVGAHLRGMPLHKQLTENNARFLEQTRTSEKYRLFALAETTPPKPGLVRRTNEGAPIEVEVYALSEDAFGRFTALVPPPLAIGNVELEDGSWVKGFVCEPVGLLGAEEITKFGGWRNYVKEKGGAP